MCKIRSEIADIPKYAREFWSKTKPYSLPLKVPYLGMGSSYFAPLAFKNMNIKIIPEIASEYYHYLSCNDKYSKAVILTQSGRSSEALWCAKLFESFIAISNNPNGELCKLKNISHTIPLLAGTEHYSSSKTYVNTLLALFKGFDMDATKAIDLLEKKATVYEETGKKMADSVFNLISLNNIHGIYIVGSGPNIATAYEAALILSESTKICFTGLPMAQYDHGPKETAVNSIVFQIVSKGKAYKRAQKVSDTISKAGAHVIVVEEPDADENMSVLHNIVPFNFMAYYLASKLDVNETFIVGGKVTEA